MANRTQVKKYPKNSQNWWLYTLSDFLVAWALNGTGWLIGTWEVIEMKSCGLERICECLYVHFEPILGFTRNEQMVCSEALRCSANFVKHPRNVKSHVGTPRNVSGESMTRIAEVEKCRKNNQNWRLLYTISDFLGDRASNGTGWFIRPWEVIGKESLGLERICACLYVHFELILGFTRNEQMMCLEALWGNANFAKHPHNVTSHAGTPRNVSGENMTRLA